MNRTTLETRCADGAACVEVVARVAAATVARHELHLPDEADRLLAAARRWAELHNYGNAVKDSRRDSDRVFRASDRRVGTH